jgi:NO-binding membrane sensor protein with MHYT domain
MLYYWWDFLVLQVIFNPAGILATDDPSIFIEARICRSGCPPTIEVENMNPIDPSYNFFLVALSFCVSVFGSYTSLLLVKAAQGSTRNKTAWIMSAALALGGGAIWTMHFIGMLAYDIGAPVNYDPWITLASLVIAIVVVGVGLFFVANNQHSVVRLLLAGGITGIGVASMHYCGMYAMNMTASMTYDPTLFALSIVIALAAATAALWLAFNLDGNAKMLGAAVIMGIAVCGMHYTGMAAMNMTPMNHSEMLHEGIKPLTLGLFIFCFSMLLLVLCLIVGMAQLSRRMYESMEEEDIGSDADKSPAVASSTLTLSVHKIN